MSPVWPVRSLLAWVALTWAVLALSAPGQMPPMEPAQPNDTRGVKQLTDPRASMHGTRRALIIGTNYANTEKDTAGVNLRLQNAENDARMFRDLLIRHYGYEEKNVHFLEGAKATKKQILEELSSGWLGNPDIVHEEDSVLVYFAGHGDVLDSTFLEDRGIIYPHDVQFQKAGPRVETVLRLQGEVLPHLKACKAQHKLLILDSCFSGWIFVGAQPRSLAEGARPALANNPAFQVLASTRSTERAADGRDGNSPFTTALVDGLKQLPTQPETQKCVTASSLFRFMSYKLRALPENQNPDCRSLGNGDGEFAFYPNPNDDFRPYLNTTNDLALLRAMVPGEYGAWWFDETPWLIPSLRRDICAESTAGQRNATGEEMSKRSLAESARRVMRKREASPLGSLDHLRLEQYKTLREAEKSEHAETLLKRLAEELEGHWHPKKDAERSADARAPLTLEAVDLHLLAVLQHRLLLRDGQDKLLAPATYRAALDLYEKARQASPTKKADPLEALCQADLATFFLEVEGNAKAAAWAFRKAGELYATDAPPPFKVYILCREADAWQRQGLAGNATDRVKWAIHVATFEMDPKDPLTAHAHQRLGCIYLEQWKMREAVEEFQQANAVLARRLPPGFFENRDLRAQRAEGGPNDPPTPDLDYNALIATTHNLAGIALAERFLVSPERAAERYRGLSEQLRMALRQLREGPALQGNVAEVKVQLLECLLETEMHLADCNLFADPGTRDLKEALDDLRRALRVCDSLPPHSRDHLKAALLYRKALALAPHSEVQDLREAQDYLKAAQAVKTDGTLEDWATLAPLVVAVLKTSGEDPVKDGTERKQAALEPLRAALLAYRQNLAQDARRDHLELLMVAARVLVDESLPDDRYHLQEDSELLLGFCRRALQNHGATGASLRQYYDAVVTAKTRGEPRQVKDLLETVYEATRGEMYPKPEKPGPVLALYIVEGRAHLFLDAPRSLGGVSKHYLLGAEYTPERLRAAVEDPNNRLTLPAGLRKDLERLEAVAEVNQPERAGEPVALQLWWEDPLVGLTSAKGRVSSGGPEGFSSFPFNLPKGIRKVDLPPQTPPQATDQVRKP